MMTLCNRLIFPYIRYGINFLQDQRQKIIVCLFIILGCPYCSDNVHAMEENSPKKRSRYWEPPIRRALKKRFFGEVVEDSSITIDNIQRYVEEGGSVNDWIDNGVIGIKPMHAAAAAGKTEVMEWLQAEGVSCVVYTNCHRLLPVHYAAKEGQLEALQWLHNNGADINVSSGVDDMKPIHYAVQAGVVDMVQWLYDKGSNIEEPTHVRFKPVHLAARAGKLNVLRWLFEHGADMDEIDCWRTQPIHSAAFGGHIHILQWFYDSMIIKPSDERWYQLFSLGVGHDHIHLVDWLHKRGLGMHYGAHGGLGSGKFAGRSGKTKIFKWLIGHGMVINNYEFRERATWLYGLGSFDWLVQLIGHGANLPSELPETLVELLTNVEPDCKPLPQITLTYKIIREHETTLTVADIFKMAAGQGNKKLIRCIVFEHGDELKQEDYADALVGAATAGHLYIVDLIVDLMSRNDSSEGLLHESLSRAFVCAASHGIKEVLFYLGTEYRRYCMSKDSIIQAFARATDSNALGVVDLLQKMLTQTEEDGLRNEGLSRALVRAAVEGNEEFINYLITFETDSTEAENALKELLSPFTERQINSDPLLQRHYRLFAMLSGQRLGTIIERFAPKGTERWLDPEIRSMIVSLFVINSLALART